MSLKKAEYYLYRLEALLVIGAFMAMLALAVVQVVTRSLGLRSMGTDEIATIASSILIFIGAGLAVYTYDHITVEVVDLIPSAKIRALVYRVGDLGLAIFGVVFTYYAFLYWRGLWISGEETLQLSIPLTIPVGAMVLGGALIAIHAILRLFLHKRRGAAEGVTTG